MIPVSRHFSATNLELELELELKKESFADSQFLISGTDRKNQNSQFLILRNQHSFDSNTLPSTANFVNQSLKTWCDKGGGPTERLQSPRGVGPEGRGTRQRGRCRCKEEVEQPGRSPQVQGAYSWRNSTFAPWRIIFLCCVCSLFDCHLLFSSVQTWA